MVYCGIDEVGRGPLAGPVTATAVVLDMRSSMLLCDSKLLSANNRAKTSFFLRATRTIWGSGWASPQEIDSINIRNATLLAMQRAYQQLAQKLTYENRAHPQLALVDGRDTPPLPIPVISIVKGDSVVPEIQAASILAKNARDLVMKKLSLRFPGYSFEQHKGYPTRAHFLEIQSFGLTPIHRRTFRTSPRFSQIS